MNYIGMKWSKRDHKAYVYMQKKLMKNIHFFLHINSFFFFQNLQILYFIRTIYVIELFSFTYIYWQSGQCIVKQKLLIKT